MIVRMTQNATNDQVAATEVKSDLHEANHTIVDQLASTKPENQEAANARVETADAVIAITKGPETNATRIGIESAVTEEVSAIVNLAAQGMIDNIDPATSTMNATCNNRHVQSEHLSLRKSFSVRLQEVHLSAELEACAA